MKHLFLLKHLFIVFFICFIYSGCSNQADSKVVASSPQPPLVKQKEVKDTLKKDVSIDFLMGKFEPSKHKDFIKIEKKYTSKNNIYLQKGAYSAFKKMYASAKKEGIELIIHSATRNFNYQKIIWESKWNGKRLLENKINAAKIKSPNERALKILEYSSMPGTSRHHWGTDIDIISFSNEYFEKGKGLKEYNWLIANAAKFGFCQPYTNKDKKRPYGYNEEKWHWSYMPISKELTQTAKEKLKNEMIKGFAGSETAKEINIVEKYILGINPKCK